MEQVMAGKVFNTTDKKELRDILNKYKLNLYKHYKKPNSIDELIEIFEEDRKTRWYKEYSIQLDVNNENIYWIGLVPENGKDSYGDVTLYKNSNLTRSKLCDVMTFSEASEKWGLSDSTLRKLVTTDKLKEGIDYRKSGNVWIITTEAMENVYGEPKNE